MHYFLYWPLTSGGNKGIGRIFFFVAYYGGTALRMSYDIMIPEPAPHKNAHARLPACYFCQLLVMLQVCCLMFWYFYMRNTHSMQCEAASEHNLQALQERKKQSCKPDCSSSCGISTSPFCAPDCLSPSPSKRLGFEMPNHVCFFLVSLRFCPFLPVYCSGIRGVWKKSRLPRFF